MDIQGSMVELKVKLVKIGNSDRMTVPVEIMQALGWKTGEILKVDAVDGKMIVSMFSIKGETKP